MTQLLEIWPIIAFLLLQLGGLLWFLSSMKERIKALEEGRCQSGKLCIDRIAKCETLFDALKEANHGQNIKINTLETSLPTIFETIHELKNDIRKVNRNG